MSAIAKGTNFPTELVTEMFNKVKGHSSIAKMVAADPVPFNGSTTFTFSMDHNIAIVGENAAKPAGDATIAPVVVRPIKVVYQSRVSDEFMTASEEARLNTLRTFADGFAKKLASGFDEMALHGVNPYDGNAASGTIANNYLDYVITNYSSGANVITYGHDSTSAVANLSEMINKVDDPTGLILGKTIRGAIETIFNTDESKAGSLAGFAFGGIPAELGGMTVDKNATVESNSSLARAYVGDFSAFQWGFAKEMPLEIIEYGDPDGAGKDLKQYNQVCLRSEAYIGWGIFDAAAFAMIKAPSV